MNAINRWNPFREMEEMQKRLTSLLHPGPMRLHDENQENITVSEWQPLVDIREDEKEYLVKVELPEVKREDVKVTVENGVLSITGERKMEKEEKGKKFHRVERSYGSFVRSFTLPDDANADNVQATFKDGLLHVKLAKHEAAKPRTVQVKVD